MGSLEISPGTVLAGKYRIEDQLGRGGMGVVFLATQLGLARQVALKFLLPELIRSNRDAVSRFKREARALARIRNEHAVEIFELEEYEGAPYIVMEYLAGTDLAKVLEAGGPLSPEVAVDYVLQACEALAVVHSLGIVHRDLKPSNLFLADRHGTPVIKVFDFGIAKSPVSELSQVAKTSGFVGSPLYCAPEQLSEAGAVDARTDVWALGVTLFELMTGRPPFCRRSIAEVFSDILTSTAPYVRTVRAEVPEGLAQAVAACLERDLGQRFQDVGELARRLAPFGPPHAQQSVQRIQQVLHAARSNPPGASGSNPPALGPARSSTLPEARARASLSERATLPADAQPSDATLTAAGSAGSTPSATHTATAATHTAAAATHTALPVGAETHRTQTLSVPGAPPQKKRPFWQLALSALLLASAGTLIWRATSGTLGEHASATGSAAMVPARTSTTPPSGRPASIAPEHPAAPAVPEKPSEVRPSNSVASAETKPASRRSKQPPKAATPPAAKPPPNPVASQAAAPATPDPGAPDLNAKPW